MLKKAKQTKNWTQYGKAQNNNEIQKSKRKFWMLSFENINNTPVVATTKIACKRLKRYNGAFTKTAPKTKKV